MSTTICITVMACLMMICITGICLIGMFMRAKSREVQEARIYVQALLDQMYYYLDKWISKLDE